MKVFVLVRNNDKKEDEYYGTYPSRDLAQKYIDEFPEPKERRDKEFEILEETLAVVPRVVTIVDGGILDEILSDTDIEVYKVDRDRNSVTKEIRRRTQADVQVDDVEKYFETPVTCDECDDDQEGGARDGVRHMQLGINEYWVCDPCARSLRKRGGKAVRS